MRYIIKNESSYRPSVEGDSDYICPATGKVSPSYGLAQISSCWHPEVTYAQATNEEFAITFLAMHLAEGRCYLWTTCPREFR